MSKRRDYFDIPIRAGQSYGLIEAAAALEYDATLIRQTGSAPKEWAVAARHYAKLLRLVAKGKTWTEAFQFPPKGATT
jgi:hypothetical protein